MGLFNFFKKEEEPQGDIKYYELTDWWNSVLTPEERKRMREVYSPMGGSKDSLVKGNIYSSTAGTLNFLWCLIGWFDKPNDRHIAFKIIKKAEEYDTDKEDTLDRYFFYSAKMRVYYKERDSNPEALDLAIAAAKQQIGISPKAVEAFKKEYPNADLPYPEGYDQLAIILEKQGKHDEVIGVCQEAKSYGWGGDWVKRIERCEKKKTKIKS